MQTNNNEEKIKVNMKTKSKKHKKSILSNQGRVRNTKNGEKKRVRL